MATDEVTWAQGVHEDWDMWVGASYLAAYFVVRPRETGSGVMGYENFAIKNPDHDWKLIDFPGFSELSLKEKKRIVEAVWRLDQ